MNKIYCSRCKCEILKKPILDVHQTRYAVVCPYCRERIIDWQNTKEETIASWNKYIREENQN